MRLAESTSGNIFYQRHRHRHARASRDAKIPLEDADRVPRPIRQRQPALDDRRNPVGTAERSHHARARREAAARRATTSKLVGLDESLLDRKPRGLGAGSLQRINIARALISQPEFLVLDEPTSVLAPRARTALIELLVKLQEELGVSYLFISHDLTTVRYLCHRVAVMYLGQIVEEGTVAEVFSAPQHPYSQALLSAHLFPDPSHRRVDHPVASALQGRDPEPDRSAAWLLPGRSLPARARVLRRQSRRCSPTIAGRTLRALRARRQGRDRNVERSGSVSHDDRCRSTMSSSSAQAPAAPPLPGGSPGPACGSPVSSRATGCRMPTRRAFGPTGRSPARRRIIPIPNVRRNWVDYPVDDSEAAIKPFLYNAVGGSTILWGAHFPRFRPSDFSVRTLDGVGDDWPIAYDDLEEYYDENDAIVGVSGLAGDPGNPPRSPRPMPPLPLGKGGARMAARLRQAGLALVAMRRRDQFRAIRRWPRRLQQLRAVRPWLPARRAQLGRHHLLAAGAWCRRQARHQCACFRDRDGCRRARDRRCLLRPCRHRAAPSRPCRRAGGQWPWHRAAHAAVAAPRGFRTASPTTSILSAAA